jgi:(1->4)-alpha-D-glucan 1-alpha-D-glucosylmutase
LNRPYWYNYEGDANAEYLLYQTLVGAWPIDSTRIAEFMLKAVREAKLHTSWTHPNEIYEKQLADFISGIFENRQFISELEGFVSPLIWPGRVNSLAQTLLKLTSPGVPDSYQGSELWDLTLVDPDNRRLVDYTLRRRLLNDLPGAAVREVLKRADEGLPKLWVIYKTLTLRARHPEWFGRAGSYEPIMPRGVASDYIVAFVRSANAITVVPRLGLKLAGKFRDTALTLPQGLWHNVFTGERVKGGGVPVASLLEKFPVCLLSRVEML